MNYLTNPTEPSVTTIAIPPTKTNPKAIIAILTQYIIGVSASE
jgi:hypothetical protein